MEAIQTDDKRREIIEAAIRRFSHFGIAKTTLSEIAEDLQMSKANLYYYFQDKWALLEAIVEVLLQETDRKIKETFTKTEGVEQQLCQILCIKFEFIEKYRLLTLNLSEVNVMDPKFRRIADQIFEKECSIVATVLENGIKSGELETIDILATSNLYVTTIRGLGINGICSHPSPIVEMETLKIIHDQQMRLTSVFVNGIMHKTVKINTAHK